MHGIWMAGAGSYWANRRAAEAASEARESKTAARNVQAELNCLEERLDQLVLLNAALWSLLQDRVGLTEQELADRVQEIDLADGTADGKITRGIQQCPKCQRTMHPRHRKCLYCGHEDLRGGAYDKI